MDSRLLDAVLGQLAGLGIDPAAWLQATARLLPSLILIPAFGLDGFPMAIRVIFALALAAVVAPVLAAAPAPPGPWLSMLGAELARGLPLALGVAAAIWSAGMAGNLIDELRRARATSHPLLGADAPLSPIGVALSLVAAIAFFQLGGPARLAEALAAAPPFGEQDLRSVALTLARSIQLAVLLAGPLLALAPFLQLARALVARSARPLSLAALLEPLEALVLLGAVALLLTRVASGIVLWLDRALPRG